MIKKGDVTRISTKGIRLRQWDKHSITIVELYLAQSLDHPRNAPAARSFSESL